jgi:hypothetical protein
MSARLVCRHPETVVATLPALLLFGDWFFMDSTPSSRGSLAFVV